MLLSTTMRLGRLIGRIGFSFGSLGSLLFYTSLWPLLHESHIICPACPYAEIPFANNRTWSALGLWLGPLFGLVYAVVGLGVGIGVSRLHNHRRQRNCRV